MARDNKPIIHEIVIKKDNQSFLDWSIRERFEIFKADEDTLTLVYNAFMGGKATAFDDEEPFMGYSRRSWGTKVRKKSEPFNKENGDLFSINTFIDYCKSGGFINYDGFGHYSDGTIVFYELEIYPSDITKGNNVRNFSHVVWYNR